MSTTKMKFTPVTDAEMGRLDRETAERDETEPRISDVSYDAALRLLRLTFKSGARLGVPIAQLNGFDGATAQQIGAAKIVSNGAALHWDKLDVQMTTLAIVQRVFKVTTVAENARRAGRASTPAKRVSSRENGKLGGRPRKKVAA